MMTLVAGSSNKGYSLLELMVVMTVIGAVTSIAALSLGSFGSGAGEKALQRLGYDVRLLSSESIVRSEVLALGLHNKGYAFMRLDTDTQDWEVIEKDRFLQAREFKAPFKINVLIGEDALTLGDSVGEPQIISLPTGEMTPFIYQLESSTEGYREQLKFDALGRVVKEDETDNKVASTAS